MNWQLIIVGAIVGAAGLYLARSVWRSWRGAAKGCSGHCKCDAPKEQTPRLIPVSSVVLRSRGQQER